MYLASRRTARRRGKNEIGRQQRVHDDRSLKSTFDAKISVEQREPAHFHLGQQRAERAVVGVVAGGAELGAVERGADNWSRRVVVTAGAVRLNRCNDPLAARSVGARQQPVQRMPKDAHNAVRGQR
jgi:hypothetical protein